MEPNSSNKKSFFSEWLEKLQQESWQLELLISGLALFGIWESQNVLRLLDYYLAVNSVSEIQLGTTIFMKLLWAGWGIFLINLLIHIIIRGFWIGAIGLRYVSGDIDFDQLNYSRRFTDYYKSRIGSFDEYIEKLEKISSVIFSFTFLLFFMFLSFVVFNLFFAIIITLLSRFFPEKSQDAQAFSGIVGIIYYGLGMLVLIDFFTLGAFKKIKDNTVSSVYIWIYRFFSTVSLSFLYRPLLLNFIDNSYTRKLFFLAIPYGLVLLGISGIYTERYPYFPSFDSRTNYSSVISENAIVWNYYDDLRTEHHNTFRSGDRLAAKTKINYVSLNRLEHTSRSEMKIFLEYRENDGENIESAVSNNGINPFRKAGIRHSIMANAEKDKGIERLDSIELSELMAMRKIIRKETYSDKTPSEWITKYSAYNEDDIKVLREEIKSDYSVQRRVYMEQKLSRLKNEFKDLYEVKIDSINMIPDMECQFYEHPNMHEKGLLCYYRLDSLQPGAHLIKVVKKNHKFDCTSDCDKRYFSIPIRITE